jgi:dienelactone hydrolase
MHGCGGLRPFMTEYTRVALAAGVAVVTVDSLTLRGLAGWRSNALVCTGAVLKGAERAADLYAIYDWVRRQSWADPDRIAAAGWSHGGWTIMDGLAAGENAGRYCRLTDLPAQPLAGLAAAIVIYPYAGFPALTIGRGWGVHRPKVFALLAGRDQVVGTRFPARAIDRLSRDGLDVERLLMAEATHAFDDERPADPRSKHRPDLREQALAWYGNALKSALLTK